MKMQNAKKERRKRKGDVALWLQDSWFQLLQFPSQKPKRKLKSTSRLATNLLQKTLYKERSSKKQKEMAMIKSKPPDLDRRAQKPQA